jgi:hypothetical protein
MKISSLSVCAFIVFGLIAGCGSASEKPPLSVPTPQLPEDWQVVETFSANQSTLSKFSEQMKAELLGVRNTTFVVDSLQIKVNTLVAANAADADSAMAFLLGMKSQDSIYRTGTTIYEFVGTSGTDSLVASGKQHLQNPSTDAVPRSAPQ